jgi:hypothetical protein
MPNKTLREEFAAKGYFLSPQQERDTRTVFNRLNRLTRAERAIAAEAKRCVEYRRSGSIAGFTQSLDKLNTLVGKGRK